jgi:hypothetical protein
MRMADETTTNERAETTSVCIRVGGGGRRPPGLRIRVILELGCVQCPGGPHDRIFIITFAVKGERARRKWAGKEKGVQLTGLLGLGRGLLKGKRGREGGGEVGYEMTDQAMCPEP